MCRPQFGLKTLLWTMALVAAFLGGRFIRLKSADDHVTDQQREILNLQRLLQAELRTLQRAINARNKEDVEATKMGWERATWKVNEQIQAVDRLQQKAVSSAAS